ncbi:MAG: 16S rRNA (cytosine(1402)-N(4))-methyltransferase RsmH [Candidatus Eisenbacteria bacterium]
MSQPPDEPTPPVHKRRVRYKGTHPKRFAERYKELAAEQYPEIVPHVMAKGRTPAGQHVPIMVDEILGVLGPEPGMRAVDCTLGYGGHARRLLERLRPGGTLLGLDADPIELPRTEARLRKLGYDEQAFVARRSNFAGLLGMLMAHGWHDGADVVLADLGVSSMQLDDPARGFTFGADGPLDMRMNPNRGLSASEWLARASMAELATALRDNADEPQAELLAESLEVRRGHLGTTRELADAVRHALAHMRDTNEVDRTVRRVFQALRIEVNDEFGTLDLLLRDLPQCLRAGGHVAILSFHSGEDRRVKKAFQSGERAGIYAAGAPDVIRAAPHERFENPRSKPAKLRWARRAG